MKCWIVEVVLGQKGVEAAQVADVTEFHAGNVVGDGISLLGHGLHPVAGHVEEFRLLVDEPGDQPGAGDAVDLWSFAGDPLHGEAPCWRKGGSGPWYGRCPHGPPGRDAPGEYPGGNAAMPEFSGGVMADLEAVGAVHDDLAVLRQAVGPLVKPPGIMV